MQDLERQLAHARHQLAHLRSAPTDDQLDNSLDHPASQPPRSGSHRDKRHKPVFLPDYTNTRRNLRKFGRDLLNLPPLSPHNAPAVPPLISPPELPPKHIADELLRSYYGGVHVTVPILHWPSFIQDYESVYQDGSFRRVTQTWCSLLFAVLALGSLSDSRQQGNRYLEVSRMLVDLWTGNFSLDHARCAVLISVFLVETNLKSKGWIWLGFAVRISQDLGLYLETGNRSASEQEVCRRVWWSTYISDRYVRFQPEGQGGPDVLSLLSLELGRPCMINDEDCHAEVPLLQDDVQLGSDLSWSPASLSPSISPFLSTLRVAREIASLLRTLKTPTIPTSTLEYHDMQLSNCMALFPAHHQIQRIERLNIHAATPMVHLQNARLLLHRHNLSIMCPPETRSAAMDQCFLIAKDTAQILSRCLIDPPEASTQHPSSQHTWTWPFKNAASTFVCTHIWRCTLFLCLRGDFPAASTCARVSAIVGDARPVNAACGKYVDFFLDHLTQKWHQEARGSADTDEEMIAYVSGDLQGSVEHSWVWQDGEDSQGRVTQSPTDGETNQVSGGGPDDGFGRAGWDAILEKMGRLQNQKPPRNRLPQPIFLSTPGNSERSPLSTNSTHPPSLPSAPSRIRIADIM